MSAPAAEVVAGRKVVIEHQGTNIVTGGAAAAPAAAGRVKKSQFMNEQRELNEARADIDPITHLPRAAPAPEERKGSAGRKTRTDFSEKDASSFDPISGEAREPAPKAPTRRRKDDEEDPVDKVGSAPFEGSGAPPAGAAAGAAGGQPNARRQSYAVS